MTEEQLKQLGFKLTKEYTHDQFHTYKYINGVLEVEFTYENDMLVNVDLTISEVNCKPITLDEIKVLTPIFGKKSEYEN